MFGVGQRTYTGEKISWYHIVIVFPSHHLEVHESEQNYPSEVPR